MTNPSVSSTANVAPSTLPGGADAATNLTPEALMIYLQTRLGGLDEQINLMFKKQQNMNRIRQDLNAIQKALQSLKNDPADKNAQGSKHPDATKNGKPDLSLCADYERQILQAIADIKELDPALGARLEAELGKEGFILHDLNGQYLTSEVKNTIDYLNTEVSRLESSAQLEMIQLQSLMSNRQTAIQLSTNLISALNESTKSIAGNIGR
jgi:hypothetical protein